VATRPAILKQSELTRYAKALRAAGVSEWRVVAHPDGSHEIVAGKTDAAQAYGPDPDELLR
jgi:hypothetical protein